MLVYKNVEFGLGYNISISKTMNMESDCNIFFAPEKVNQCFVDKFEAKYPNSD